MSRRTSLFVFALCLLAPAAPPARARQDAAAKPRKATTTKAAAAKPAAEADPLLEVRRTTAISLINALADDARNFRDQTLRARVQARAADALWETDREKAATLFRRAWEAAEAADVESERRVDEERRRQVAETRSFSMRIPPSMRTEVLRLAAKRDRALGEEFLTQMEKSKAQASESLADRGGTSEIERESAGGLNRPSQNPNEPPSAVAKRLRLAIQLLEDGDPDRATQFADAALARVSAPALEFLARLRPKNAAAADQRYAAMLARAPTDPESDANTASMLASYIFTPALYITFTPDAGSSSNSWGRDFPKPADISPQLRALYFNTAAAILLRPIPPADQDRTSSGRAGWWMVIARLLPLFDQFAPDKSAALRAQMGALTPDTPERARQPNNLALTRGLVPEDPSRDRLQETLNRLDRAKTTDERDNIYVDAVFNAVRQKDPRVGEFIDKIENLELRRQVRNYVDYEAAQRAAQEREAPELLRLARAGELTPIQRAWALTEVAELLAKKEPGRAIEILEEALAETKRIDAASPERVSALVAIATQMSELDRPRVWEVMIEAVKASNAAAEYTGEDGQLSVGIRTKSMGMMSTSSIDSFDLQGVFKSLAKENMDRAVELARAFQGEAPRAVATLSIARAVLEKN